MIVKMQKVFVVSHSSQRDRLLSVLRELGVVHLQPVNPDSAAASAKTLSQIDHLKRAIQVLDAVEPHGQPPDMEPMAAAEQVLQLQREAAEGRTRLMELHRQIEQLEMWGDVKLEQFAQLHSNGIEVRFYSTLPELVGQFEAELVHVLGELPRGRTLVAVIYRQGRAESQITEIPAQAEPVDLPQRDRPDIRAEAQRIDRSLKTGIDRLNALGHLRLDMQEALEQLEVHADYSVARGGALVTESFFAIQGWAPVAEAGSLGLDIAAAGIDAAVDILEPTEDEEPPTLIRYSCWARPIKALFDMLGTIPGFREFDLSGFFMISMPVFVAMLIGDAGYGLIFLILSLVLYRKFVAKAGAPATHLVLVFSLGIVIWGVLTANYFGVTPKIVAEIAGITRTINGQAVGDVEVMLSSGEGAWASVGKAMFTAAPLYRTDDDAARNLIIKISFVIGCIHLICGQLRQAVGKIPDIRFLAHIGWTIVLPGMLGMIWQLFFIGIEKPWSPWIFGLIGGGWAMVVLFSFPSRNIAKMLGLGIVANIMPIINAFSDTMSYIRLMAVGLASYYIAYSFNLLGSQVAAGSHWIFSVPIILFGHVLNIGLGLIAVFAHGVRLNMLEFSSNAGVQWAGYAYKPFAKRTYKES